jgi:hypothetical protein
LSLSTTTGTSSDNYGYVVLGLVPGNSSHVENLRVF